jgi:hypothetical protein
MFCKTIKKSVRIHLAMCLLSIGYVKMCERVFALTGLSLGSFTYLYLRSKRQAEKVETPSQKELPTKKIQMMKFYKRLREGGWKSVQENAKN